MPTAGGPNTLGESNLVFAYDTGDVKNSYIGEPTVNIHADSEDVNEWTGNLFGNWINSGVASNTVVAPNGTLTGDIIGDGFGRFNISSTATPGQAYTYSVYLKNVTLTSGFYIWYAFGLNGSLVSYGQALFIPITSINNSEWTRFSATISAPGSGINQVQFGPCPFTGYNYGSTYSSPTYNASGAQLAVWGGQIEQKSHVTPYTAGTRSVTQGLLDLTGNRTIDLSNASFNSNAQMIFDGTNDYIETSAIILTSDFTISQVINLASSANGPMPIGGGYYANGSTYQGYVWFRNNVNQVILAVDGELTVVFSVASTLWVNKTIMYTIKRSGSTATFYINGAEIATGTISTNSFNIRTIGYSYSTSYVSNGTINNTFIYNRALTPLEIQQNYQQYKTRFNLS